MIWVLIRHQPFSLMALGNMLGDVAYLGYAFHSNVLFSGSKLAGAMLAALAHVVLLAYGDSERASETGLLPSVVWNLRRGASYLLSFLPTKLLKSLSKHSVGFAFTLLSCNGIGLLCDALSRKAFLNQDWNYQAALGFMIILGCGAFAASDFIQTARLAVPLRAVAPFLLTFTYFPAIGLAVGTRNPFLILSLFAFSSATVASYFTSLKPRHSPSIRVDNDE